MNQREPFDDVPRRGFMAQLAAFLVGLIVTAIPAAIAAVFVANPLYRRRSSTPSGDTAEQEGFIRLAIGPDAVPGDGTPVSVTVVTDTSDAWNYHPAQSVGTIWLRRDERSKLIAFSSICPHLGCRVLLREQGGQHFFCPCHDSQFTLNGEPTNRIPPRAMDQLETKLIDGRVWVRYLEFRGGIQEKIPV